MITKTLKFEVETERGEFCRVVGPACEIFPRVMVGSGLCAACAYCELHSILKRIVKCSFPNIVTYRK